MKLLNFFTNSNWQQSYIMLDKLEKEGKQTQDWWPQEIPELVDTKKKSIRQLQEGKMQRGNRNLRNG